MQQEIIKEAEGRMRKSIDALHLELTKLRLGRAVPSLLDHVTVSYYGTATPLNQVANITVLDARTLMVSPWEKNLVQDVEKAILTSDLGLNPATSSDGIRIPLPALTQERRKELTKVVRNETENTKVAVRNIRRDANHTFKELVKEKAMSEDDEHRAQDQVQKLTDSIIAEVDTICSNKEKELMEI
jgi:ribosome recycling factor